MEHTQPKVSEDFDLDAYLDRIGYTGTLKVNEEALHALHLAHVMSIPFENLDIHLGRPISLEPGAIFDKLVARRRGGYCFETNGLFIRALDALGFNTRPLLARVWYGGATEPRARTHLVTRVKLSGHAWLADVGFGGRGTREPILMEAGRGSAQMDGCFRLTDAGIYGLMLQYKDANDWDNLYSFTQEPSFPADFCMANHFTSTSPESLFTQRRIVARVTASGRTHLLDLALAVVEGGERQEATAEPGAAYMKLLETHFGLSLDVQYSDFRAPHGVD